MSQFTWVRSLGRKDPLEKEMATHSNILAWRIPWMEEFGGLQSTGCKESDTTEQLHFTSLLHQVAKDWRFSLSISPSNEYSGLIAFV